jgi:hypothetical protein
MMMRLDVSWMIGRELVDVSLLQPANWGFGFAQGGLIQAECPWRVLVNSRIVLSSDDHGHQYGNSAPLDVEVGVRSILLAQQVRSAEVCDDTRDIRVSFASGARLEILPLSSGYESWQIVSPNGERTVAQGGGNLVEL